MAWDWRYGLLGMPTQQNPQGNDIRRIGLLSAMSGMGQGLMAAGGMPMQGRQPNLLRLYAFKKKQEEEQKRQQAGEKLMEAYRGNPGLLGTPEGRGLLFDAAPDFTMRGMAEEAFASPAERKTYQDQFSATRFLDTGELVPGETARGMPEPPKTYTRKEGDEEVTYRWDPETQTEIEVARAPRYKPAYPNLPRVDPGYQLTPTKEGGWRAEPIPGSKAERDIMAGEEAKAAEAAQTQKRGDIVLQDIDRAVGLVSGQSLIAPVTGIGGAAAEWIPGSRATDYNELVSTIGAQITMENLKDLRAASPTGSTGLGPLSEREGAMLRAAYGSLENAQSEEQLLQNLQRLKRLYLQVVHGPKGAEEIQQLEQMSNEDLLDESKIGGFTPDFYEYELRRRGML